MLASSFRDTDFFNALSNSFGSILIGLGMVGVGIALPKGFLFFFAIVYLVFNLLIKSLAYLSLLTLKNIRSYFLIL